MTVFYEPSSAASEVYDELPKNLQDKYNRSAIRDIFMYLMEAEDEVDDFEDVDALLEYVNAELGATEEKLLSKKELEVLIDFNDAYIDSLEDDEE